MVLDAASWRENPVFANLMGLRPALAVANRVPNGLAMALATAFMFLVAAARDRACLEERNRRPEVRAESDGLDG